MTKYFCSVIIASLFILGACSGGSEKESAEVALETAKTYYQQLFNGDANSFVEGSLQGDSVPPAYKSQLILNAQMFVERINKEHNGLKSLKTLKAQADSVNAIAYIAMEFNDSTREELAIPMTKKNDIWYLK